MSQKTPVSSWADLVKKAKKDEESLGETMSRLSGTWSSVKEGTHPDYSYSPGTSSSPVRKKTASVAPARAKKSKKRKGTGGPKRQQTRRRKRAPGKQARSSAAGPGAAGVSRELANINKKLDDILDALRESHHSRS